MKALNSLVKILSLVLFFGSLRITSLGGTTTKQKSAQPALFFIEGNTGAGKSTLCSLIEEACDADIIAEPIKKWQKFAPQVNLLDAYLHDRSRYAYAFHSYAYMTYIQACLEIDQTKTMHLVDRSIFSSFYCFTSMLLKEGSINNIEYQLLQKQFEFYVHHFPCVPTGIIYLRTIPETCYERIMMRGRSEEQDLDFNFLKLLHEAHEDWLIQKKVCIPEHGAIPILILEGDCDFQHDTEIRTRFIDAIRLFCEETTHLKGMP